jgi:Uma2 family endonuclease
MATATIHPPPAKARSRLMTSEEFLDWLEPGIHADLIGGEVFMHSPVHFDHARLTSFLDHLLRSYLEHAPLGELHRETVAVRLSVRDTFLPDIAFFPKSQLPRLLGTHSPVPPVFVCEVLSKTTASNDTGRKFAAYERHGVQEYWVLDPAELNHRFYRLEADTFVEFASDGEVIESVTIAGFWVRRAWLNPRKLPRVGDCLTEVLATKRRRRRR